MQASSLPLNLIEALIAWHEGKGSMLLPHKFKGAELIAPVDLIAALKVKQEQKVKAWAAMPLSAMPHHTLSRGYRG